MATWQPAAGAAACQPHVPCRVSPRLPRPRTFVLHWPCPMLPVWSEHHPPQPRREVLPLRIGTLRIGTHLGDAQGTRCWHRRHGGKGVSL